MIRATPILLFLLICHLQLWGQIKRKPLIIEVETLQGSRVSGRILDVLDSGIYIKDHRRTGIRKGLLKDSDYYSYRDIKSILSYRSKAKKGAIAGLAIGAGTGVGLALATNDGFFPTAAVAVVGGTFLGAAGTILGAIIGSSQVRRVPDYLYLDGKYQNFVMGKELLWKKAWYRPKRYKVYYSGGRYFPMIDNVQTFNSRPRNNILGFSYLINNKFTTGIYWQSFSELYREFNSGDFKWSEYYDFRNIGFELNYNILPTHPGIESRGQLQAGAAFLIAVHGISTWVDYQNRVTPGLNLSLTGDFYIFRNISVFLRPSIDLKPSVTVDGYIFDQFDPDVGQVVVIETVSDKKINASTFILGWGIKVHLP